MARRRLLAVGLVWLAAAGLWRGVVALPERCPPVTATAARAAAVEAIGWFDRNQLGDGRWAYRYDRETGVVDDRVHVVRHAGVTMALYQAAAAGIDPRAERLADGGARWLLRHLVHHDGWVAVRYGNEVSTGAAAILVAGLGVRRVATGDDRYDERMRGLGRFLVAMTEPSGAVLASWDPGTERPVAGLYSTFFTGETMFALAWLATVFPGEGWEVHAAGVARYVAAERDRAEARFPPTSDHWGAQGIAQLVLGAGVPVGAVEIGYERRLAGIFGVQVRYESQRSGSGLNRRLLRGPLAVGSGVGTLGEGLGALWRLAVVAPALWPDREVVAERLRCVAGMLVDRQVTAAEADQVAASRRGVEAAGVRGAWFHGPITQEDDQQHAISALLAAAPALEEGGGRGGGSGRPNAPRLLWLAVVAVAAVNPARVTRPRMSGSWSSSTQQTAGSSAGALATGVVLTAAVFSAGPVLRAIDVSPPTALVAAGFVLAPSAVADLVGRRGAAPAGGVVAWVLAVLRPAVVAVVLAVAADAGVPTGLVLAAVVAVVPSLPWPSSDGLARAAGAVAMAGAVDLVVHGALNV